MNIIFEVDDLTYVSPATISFFNFNFSIKNIIKYSKNAFIIISTFLSSEMWNGVFRK